MAGSQLRLFTVFHLNLAYSSIEEEQRPDVIQRCYWPLLRLARHYGVPLGIEASGYTLETAAAIDPAWIAELRRLTAEGVCEFIGSGYAQIIGPLVPADVNAANLRLGSEVYERLVGFRPRVALVNEQAYSAGLLRHYVDAGYQAIVMEWDNPASCHLEWPREWGFLPQIAVGQSGEEIPVIWGNSIAFQKFQRYAHGDLEMEEHVAYLKEQVGESPRAFSLYSNDVEVFDFRPGRYHTEAALQKGSEWERIGRLLQALQADESLVFISPSEVLELLSQPGAGNRLHLESAREPVPVKKQGKYNLTRWAVTGRDSLSVNTACWRIHTAFRQQPDVDQEARRELCYLWSSDFRTHITASRWKRYLERLAALENRVSVDTGTVEHGTVVRGGHSKGSGIPTVERQGRWLIANTESVRVRLSCRRGLTIDGLWLGSFDGPPLCGTLPHGYYTDIAMGADWYTGHVIMEPPGQPKVTDLSPVEPTAQILETGDILVETTVATGLGPVVKRMLIRAGEPRVELSYRFDWETVPLGSLRLVNVTLNPEAFDSRTLGYRTHNGGRCAEQFALSGEVVQHGEPISSLVSATSGIGITEGWVEIRDATRGLRVEVDKTSAAMIGFLTYRELGDSYFCRLALSAAEVDETRRQPLPPFRREIRCAISLTRASKQEFRKPAGVTSDGQVPPPTA